MDSKRITQVRVRRQVAAELQGADGEDTRCYRTSDTTPFGGFHGSACFSPFCVRKGGLCAVFYKKMFFYFVLCSLIRTFAPQNAK
jgi:hypothetical protein